MCGEARTRPDRRRRWAQRLRVAGADPGEPEPVQRARVPCRLAGQFGDTVVLPIMRDRERESTEAYTAGDDAPESAADERERAEVIEALVEKPAVSRSDAPSRGCSAVVATAGMHCEPPCSA